MRAQTADWRQQAKINNERIEQQTRGVLRASEKSEQGIALSCGVTADALWEHTTCNEM